MPYVGTGIKWDDMNQEALACRENGWRNLLYINNFNPPS